MSVPTMPRFLSHPFRVPALLACLALALPLQAEPASERVSDRVRERVLRMTDFFDTMLPGVLDQHNVTLHFTPKFSDLRDNEFMRFPLELRYGLSERWELSGGLSPFTPNPFNGGRDHRWGP